MRKVTTLSVVPVLVAATLALAGCGGTASSGTASTAAPASRSTTASTTTASTTTSPSTTGSSTMTTMGGTGTAKPAAHAVIMIKNFKYQVSGPVQPGETITVKNSDDVAHTVTADQSKSLFDVTVQPGQPMTFTAPAKAGTYKFGCNFHANMHGQLVVK